MRLALLWRGAAVPMQVAMRTCGRRRRASWTRMSQAGGSGAGIGARMTARAWPGLSSSRRQRRSSPQAPDSTACWEWYLPAADSGRGRAAGRRHVLFGEWNGMEWKAACRPAFGRRGTARRRCAVATASRVSAPAAVALPYGTALAVLRVGPENLDDGLRLAGDYRRTGRRPDPDAAAAKLKQNPGPSAPLSRRWQPGGDGADGGSDHPCCSPPADRLGRAAGYERPAR